METGGRGDEGDEGSRKRERESGEDDGMVSKVKEVERKGKTRKR